MNYIYNLETGEIELDFISQIITKNQKAIKAIAHGLNAAIA